MGPSIAIVLPCYNEEVIVRDFLRRLEKQLAALSYPFHVVAVNDSSTDQTLQFLSEYTPSAPNVCISVLDLAFNQGHQGAIYQGMVYAENLPVTHCIVMDSDGEDDPKAIKKLVDYLDYDIVKVIRGKRNENLRFKIGYAVYRFIFRIITGRYMNYGNFVLINRKVLLGAVHNSFIHLAAYLVKQKGRQTGFRWDRSKRLGGKSKMNLAALIEHGIRSMIELSKEMLFSILKLFIIFISFFVFGIGIVLYKKMVGDAIIGWSSTLIMILFLAGLICLGIFITGTLLVNILDKNKNSNKVVLYRLHSQKNCPE
ncbi:MAG: glycosyltransferase [Prolixibacteraceae bacterium]|jgi:glycosyltransferase involved in cell wall biosynthesis|nr:glycosyltransferase [Prolixibacteraceae bacterium]